MKTVPAPSTPRPLRSDQVSDEEVKTPEWMLATMTYQLQVASLGEIKARFVYRFRTRQHDMSIGNLVMLLRQLLHLARHGHAKYFVDQREIVFTPELMYKSLRGWLRKQDLLLGGVSLCCFSF